MRAASQGGRGSSEEGGGATALLAECLTCEPRQEWLWWVIRTYDVEESTGQSNRDRIFEVDFVKGGVDRLESNLQPSWRELMVHGRDRRRGRGGQYPSDLSRVRLNEAACARGVESLSGDRNASGSSSSVRRGGFQRRGIRSREWRETLQILHERDSFIA